MLSPGTAPTQPIAFNRRSKPRTPINIFILQLSPSAMILCVQLYACIIARRPEGVSLLNVAELECCWVRERMCNVAACRLITALISLVFICSSLPAASSLAAEFEGRGRIERLPYLA